MIENMQKKKRNILQFHIEKKKIYIYIYRNAENEKYIQKSIAC